MVIFFKVSTYFNAFQHIDWYILQKR